MPAREDASFELLHSELSAVVPLAVALFVLGVCALVAAHLARPGGDLGLVVTGAFALFAALVAGLAAIRRFGERNVAGSDGLDGVERARS